MLGGVLIVLGLFFLWGHKIPGLNRLGKLPGDIRIEKDNFSFYFPWVTSLVISVVLTLLFYFFSGGRK